VQCACSLQNNNFLVACCHPSRLHEFSSIVSVIFSKQVVTIHKKGEKKKKNTGSISPLSLAALHLSTLHSPLSERTLHPHTMPWSVSTHHTYDVSYPTCVSTPNYIPPMALRPITPLLGTRIVKRRANKGTPLSIARLHANCKTGWLTGSRETHQDTTLIETVFLSSDALPTIAVNGYEKWSGNLTMKQGQATR
jgi:hypothetical protein